jgi:hypothetical protein
VQIPDWIIAWLLGPANPSVRCGTLTELLDRPAADSAIVEAREAIPESRQV